MGFAVATNQQINNYYDTYRETEIVFTKDILRTLRIDPRQIYIKCGGSQWPCIINSNSFQHAKIIVGTSGGAFAQITKKDAPPVNLRYYFFGEDNTPLAFFVTCHVTNVTPYMNSQELAIVTLTFTQRPPDDLIYRLGSLMDANDSFVNRKEDRINIDEITQRKLGIDKKETIVFIQNVPRRCLLINLSFSGAKIVFVGVPQFLNGKNIILRLLCSDPNEIIDIKGTIVAVDNVEGRKDLVQAGIKFDEAQVPLSYKMRLNNYLTTNRKLILTAAGASKHPGAQDGTDKVITEAALAQKQEAQEAAKATQSAPQPAQQVQPAQQAAAPQPQATSQNSTAPVQSAPQTAAQTQATPQQTPANNL